MHHQMRDEVVVPAHESGNSAVMVFGEAMGLAAPIVTALRSNGAQVTQSPPPCTSPRQRPRRRTDAGDPDLSDDSQYCSIGSAIIILDSGSAESLFAERISCASRRRLRSRENDISRSAVSTVLGRAATRILLICDARRLSFGQRARAHRRLRDLAGRITYESTINGVDNIVTSYALCDTEDDVRRIADAVVLWHNGNRTSDVAPARRSAA